MLYKNPKTQSYSKRSINIFYIEYDFSDNIVKIIDFISEYMYYNNLDQNHSVLVKLFVKRDEPVSTNVLLNECDRLSENIIIHANAMCSYKYFWK